MARLDGERFETTPHAKAGSEVSTHLSSEALKSTPKLLTSLVDSVVHSASACAEGDNETGLESVGRVVRRFADLVANNRETKTQLIDELIEFATTAFEQADYESALSTLRLQEAICQSLMGSSDLESKLHLLTKCAQGFVLAGESLVGLGRFEEADDAFSKSETIFKEFVNLPTLRPVAAYQRAVVRSRRGSCELLKQSSHLKIAETHFQIAHERLLRLVGDGQPQSISDILVANADQYSSLLAERGDWEAAHRVCQETLETVQSLVGTDGPGCPELRGLEAIQKRHELLAKFAGSQRKRLLNRLKATIAIAAGEYQTSLEDLGLSASESRLFTDVEKRCRAEHERALQLVNDGQPLPEPRFFFENAGIYSASLLDRGEATKAEEVRRETLDAASKLIRMPDSGPVEIKQFELIDSGLNQLIAKQSELPPIVSSGGLLARVMRQPIFQFGCHWFSVIFQLVVLLYASSAVHYATGSTLLSLALVGCWYSFRVLWHADDDTAFLNNFVPLGLVGAMSPVLLLNEFGILPEGEQVTAGHVVFVIATMLASVLISAILVPKLVRRVRQTQRVGWYLVLLKCHRHRAEVEVRRWVSTSLSPRLRNLILDTRQSGLVRVVVEVRAHWTLCSEIHDVVREIEWTNCQVHERTNDSSSLRRRLDHLSRWLAACCKHKLEFIALFLRGGRRLANLLELSLPSSAARSRSVVLSHFRAHLLDPFTIQVAHK